MSMPEFPEVNPELTRDQALNMILSSIAMEEMALSHIIEAEGEKLQYVINTLGAGCGKQPDAGELLAVNKSVTCLLDSVSQNQMILKSKMENALGAMPPPCPEPPPPPCPGGGPCGCCAAFKSAGRCRLWCRGEALEWRESDITGRCALLDHYDKTKICPRPGGRYLISFAVNVKAHPGCGQDAAISLRLSSGHRHTDVFTLRGCAAGGRILTLSMGGIIIEAVPHAPCSLQLRLATPEPLVAEDAMLSVIEI